MRPELEIPRLQPRGTVKTYGSIAEVLRDRTGRGGAQQVGQVLARAGADVPWWRVVNASGRSPAPYRSEALRALRSEGCQIAGASDEDARVIVRDALWWPEESLGPDTAPPARPQARS